MTPPYQVISGRMRMRIDIAVPHRIAGTIFDLLDRDGFHGFTLEGRTTVPFKPFVQRHRLPMRRSVSYMQIERNAAPTPFRSAVVIETDWIASSSAFPIALHA